MPRGKIYNMPRADIHFRIDKEKQRIAEIRRVELGFPTFSKYLESLVDDDLLMQTLEKKKEILSKFKGSI